MSIRFPAHSRVKHSFVVSPSACIIFSFSGARSRELGKSGENRVNLRRQVGKLNGSAGHPFQLGGTCECFITETVQHIPRPYLRGPTEEASFNLPVEITNSVHESQPMSTPSLFPHHYDSHIIRRTYTSSYIEPDIPVETLVKTIRRELP